MPRPIRRIRGFLCLLGGLCCGLSSASAYDIGGHHYTISAIFADAQPQQTRPDPNKILEAFCAQLPDLAGELDAITQRIHVLKSLSDWQWGSLGRCSTTVSSHMVAAQWYLHGLTGLPARRVRSAASAIVAELSLRLHNERDPSLRLRLACEIGFGLHLLGDSFAHDKLQSPGTMYKTGNGHWREVHMPDYMLSRDLTDVPPGSKHWIDWVETAAAILEPQEHTTPLTDLRKPILNDASLQGKNYGEDSLTGALTGSVSKSWEPYQPSLEAWRPKSLTGDISDVTCQDVLTRGLLASGAASEQSARQLDCNAVWADYLVVAIRVFRDHAADSVRDGNLGGCDAASDKLSDGR